ncbi:MAG TPA: glycosyl hydrolase family 18 protein [Bacilli bacterium]|nr:glycosyl hydrolase family 18 protein [Bacilli bacterium]
MDEFEAMTGAVEPELARFFERAEVKREGEEVSIVLHLHPQWTEFAAELGEETEDGEKERLLDAALRYAKAKWPQLKKASVKVMLGSMMLAAIPLSSTGQALAADNFNMGYLYFGTPQTFVQFVDRTRGALQVASPSYFDLTADGQLQLTGQVAPFFIDEMHKRGIKVTPFVSNHWDRVKGRMALQNREQLSTQIADAVKMYKLDGVNVDIENVTEVDRAAYTDFVRLLREKLPEGTELSVAVAANPNGWTKGWHGSYDYNALAQYADYLVIMAYDESYPGGPAGPVSSIDFTRRSIDYAIHQGVAPQKIVLGLPLYGRYWKAGEAVGGIGVSDSRVKTLIANHNATVRFDEATQSAVATFTIPEGSAGTTFSNQSFGPGTYTIWFENDETVRAKVELAEQYGLKGTAEWSLGQEDPTRWDQLSGILKGDVTPVAAQPATSVPEPQTPTPPKVEPTAPQVETGLPEADKSAVQPALAREQLQALKRAVEKRW